MARLRTLTLRRGKKLYHGTSVEEDFDVPTGPAWLSDSEDVAEYFSHGGKGRPRILTYRLKSNIQLARVEESVDFDTVVGEEDAAREYADPRDLADAVCQRHEGWIIPNNYSSGADIMICEPNKYLRAVRSRPLGGAPTRTRLRSRLSTGLKRR